MFKLYDKDHKVMWKATRKATAKLMKQCVRRRWSALHYFAEAAKASSK